MSKQLIVWQGMQSALSLGTDWKLEIAQTTQSTIACTQGRRGSALRLLELLRREVTGARALSMPLGSNRLSSLEEKELVEGLALDIFLEYFEEAWVVAPETFFQLPASLPPSRLPSPQPPPSP